MSEDIKEVNEIKGSENTEATEDLNEAVSADAPEPAKAARSETRLEWRETLGLQLSDIEDYQVNAGEKATESEAADVLESSDGRSSDSPEAGSAESGAVQELPAGPVLSAREDALDAAPGGSSEGKRKGGFLRYLLAFLIGAACCLGVLVLLLRSGTLGRIISNSDYLYYSGLDESYGKFYEIMEMIGEDPIAEKDPKDISDEELKEIVASIGDPYAEYYTAAEYEEMLKRFANDYVGIGIGVVEENGEVVIKTIFENTPAEEAGIQAEDVILKVDGKAPAGVDDAVSKISGEAGTEVTVTVRRGGETLDFTVKRARIETASVSYGKIEGHSDIGYISMSMFRKGTDKEFKDAVKALKEEGCDKFVLDLRDNGGGLTDVCIEIADYLLPSCRIMTENSKRGDETVYNSKPDSADLELIVLVNENTASASEILTAALQDNGACRVIGTNTFGKGVIQIMHQFDDGSGIKITTTEYFRPNGEPVNGVGITPDIDTGDGDALETAIDELTK